MAEAKSHWIQDTSLGEWIKQVYNSVTGVIIEDRQQVSAKGGDEDEEHHAVRREPLRDYFERCIEPVLGKYPGDPTSHHATAVACCTLLCPWSKSPPPEPVITELAELIRRYASHPAIDLAVAYGLKWQRSAVTGNRDWDGAWPDAVKETVDLAHNFVLQARKILEKDVPGDFELPHEECQSYAMKTVQVFSSPPSRSGTIAQRQYQSAHCWDPQLSNLPGWVQRAVPGDKPSVASVLNLWV